MRKLDRWNRSTGFKVESIGDGSVVTDIVDTHIDGEVHWRTANSFADFFDDAGGSCARSQCAKAKVKRKALTNGIDFSSFYPLEAGRIVVLVVG